MEVSKSDFDRLCASVRRLAAFVMWHKGTKTMPQEHSPGRELHHQRVDHACPGETTALNVEDLDKNDKPTSCPLGQWSRMLWSQAMKSSHLQRTRLRARARGIYLLPRYIIDERTRLAQTTMSC